jgi:hypothetical protein
MRIEEIERRIRVVPSEKGAKAMTSAIRSAVNPLYTIYWPIPKTCFQTSATESSRMMLASASVMVVGSVLLLRPGPLCLGATTGLEGPGSGVSLTGKDWT